LKGGDKLDVKDMKKGMCNLKLNSITSVDNDPLLSKLTFSILDFNVSGNKQIIDKDLAIEASPTLKGKPLLCVYSENTNTIDDPNDHFNDHGECEKVDRYGNEYIGTNSIAIGTALEGGYITTIINDNGEDEEILACDFYVWNDRNVEIIQLINEMNSQNIPLYSSCEYYYKNFEMKDGVEIIKSPLIFSGHCCLDSGENNSQKVEPAYDSSKLLSFNTKFKEAVHKAINNKNKENDLIQEGDKMENKIFELLKSNNAISSGSIRWRIYDELSKVMTAEVYNNMYISEYDIYPEEHYFTYDTYIDGEGYKLFKCSYSVDGEDNVAVDYANVQEVEYRVDLQPVAELQTSLNTKTTELEQANETIKSLNTQLNEKEETIKSLNTEKSTVVEKFNSASDTVVSLNSKVDELTSKVEVMQPLIDQYNQEKFEKALNSATEDYKDKFNKVGALEIFEEESTKELIKKTLNSKTEESNEAKFQLNQLIIDNIKGISNEKDEDETIVKSINSIVPPKENKDLTKDFKDTTYEEICGISMD
jgi:cation transport regulator ChaB